MKFYTASSTKRPIRLSQKTRQWAKESMLGKYGEEARQNGHINITYSDFESLSNLDKYDHIIKQIALKSPIRICENELISGSATLGTAINHEIPAYYNGKAVFRSISHITIDYATTLRYGINGYEEKIKLRLRDENLSNGQKRFLLSLLNVIDALRIYHERYLKATKNVKPQIYKNLTQVPFKPATNFHEAVQSIWFIFSFLRLTGNWPGIGRLDWLLGSYLKNDLVSGKESINSAREIMASFFIKGTEWIEKNSPINSGDAQHYQNIVLAGVDENGREVTNEVTYLALDVVEELGISDYPITVRINEKTPKKLLNKVARVIRHGGGVVAVYNENLILNALTNYGYKRSEALNFANDGCWEVQIPGKTLFGYMPIDAVKLLQVTLDDYNGKIYNDFSTLYNDYISLLGKQVEKVCKARALKDRLQLGGEENSMLPSSVISLFVSDCIGRARSYYEGGSKYTVFSPHIGGIADAVNCLYAIKKLIFEEKVTTFATYMQALKNNWNGYEKLKSKALSLKYYGTDNDEVDGIYATLLHDFYLTCKRFDDNERKINDIFYPAGVSTFGREIDWLPYRLATAEGFTKGSILAGNASPTPGTDTEGATAVIKSYCKANLSEMVTGTALDIKLSPTAINGKNGVNAIISLIKGFVSLGGYFMQLDCVSAKTLKKAQQNPQEYKTLSVRVSGWNARFITLTKEWQDMVIQRTEHNA